GGIGQGAEFEVVLPQSELEETTEALSSVDQLQAPTTRNRVLVVDDNEDIASMYEILLGAAGYETRSVSKPREAIGLFKTFRPHFALLDIGMPDMNGYELCRELSALPDARDTIFLS